MTGTAVFLLSLGKWRYFLTGLALSLLLYTVMRTFSALTAPLFTYYRFTGTCTGIRRGQGTAILTVSFTDRNRLTRTAAFVTRHPSAEAIQVQDTVRFAIRRSEYAAGCWPQSADEPQGADGALLLDADYRHILAAVLGRTAVLRLLCCAAAAAGFLAAMKLCFP